MQDDVGGKALVDTLSRVVVTQTEAGDHQMLAEIREEPSDGKLKKPPTAYFLFMMDQRKERVGMSMKDIAAIWGDMGTEEKQSYIQKANQLKEEYQKKVQLLAETQKDDENGEEDLGEANGERLADDDIPFDANDLLNAVLPLGRLKAIAKLDPELSDGVRAEAWKGLQQATFQFLTDFLRKSLQEMMRQKKKRLTGSHLLATADQEAIYSWLLQANIWGDELPKYQKEAEAAFLKKKDRFSTPQKEDRKNEKSLEKAIKFSPKVLMHQERLNFPSQAQAQPQLSAPTPSAPPKAVQPTPRSSNLTSYFQKKV